MTTDAPQPIPLTPIPDHIHCPKCAYDLTASTSPKCSECGYDLAGFRQKESAIPWTHRKTQGYLRTYAKTVWLVIFKQKKFCEEIVRPVSYGDARKFQLITILLVIFPTFATVYAAYWWYPCHVLEFPNENMALLWTGPVYPIYFDFAYAKVWPIALSLISYFIFLLIMTGIPSFFFHPKEMPIHRQNSAIAMSYYSVAPMSFIIVVYACDLLIFHYLWPSDWQNAHAIRLPQFLKQFYGFPILVSLEVVALALCPILSYANLEETIKRI